MNQDASRQCHARMDILFIMVAVCMTDFMAGTGIITTMMLVDGTKVVVPDSLDQITPYVLQEQGDWFEDEIKFLRRLVQPGQTVVDIGANVGVYALSLARCVGESGQVWAFEPASATAELLAEGITANGLSWMRMKRMALSDQRGTAWLRIGDQSELNSLAHPSGEALTSPQGPGEATLVSTLDACMKEFCWQTVDLLKIDAEGEESRILAGGERFFRELSPLVMFEVKAGRDLNLGLVESFRKLGYEVFQLVPGLDVLAPFDLTAGVDPYLLNLFAAKPDRSSALEAMNRLVKSAELDMPESQDLEAYHWRISLSSPPYGQFFQSNWKEANPAPPELLSGDPLALWAYSQDTIHPVKYRLGALRQSYQLIREMARERGKFTRLSTLARIATNLGERSAAVRALGQLIPILESDLEASYPEPFLPPSARFDGIDPQGQPREWLLAAALEADEMLGSHSGFFTGNNARSRLERMQLLGFVGAHMNRRLWLLDQRFPPPLPATPDMEDPSPEQIHCAKKAWELINKGKTDEGNLCLSQALSMGNCCSEAQYWIAKCRKALGQKTLAISCFQRSIELNPHHPRYILDLGLLLSDEGQREEAEAMYHQVILLYGFLQISKELSLEDFFNIGIAYQKLQDSRQALHFFDQVLAAESDNISALIRKAMCLCDIPGSHDLLLETLDQALQVDRNNTSALSMKAKYLQRFGEVDEAISLLERALDINPGHIDAHLVMGFATSTCDRDVQLKRLKFLRDYWQQYRDSTGIKDFSFAMAGRPALRSGKIRIGILSGELGEHVVSLFIEPFLLNYDKQQFEVELIETKDYGGDWALWLASKADAVVSVADLPLEIARNRLRLRSYDIIVETSGFTNNLSLRILASRCAPVQCHYIGFHASTGLDTIDWFIGDQITAARDVQNQFVERLWPLPRPWLAWVNRDDYPDCSSASLSPNPIWGSFNQFAKVREETIQFWAAALRKVPNAELYLKNHTTTSHRPRRRILEALERQGINPRRIHFLPRVETRSEHWTFYRKLDLALDTTPWSGATTTFDALVMGVPVVAIYGKTMAGRMTASILHALGREAWCAETPEIFAEIVAKLSENIPRLRASRPTLRQELLQSLLVDGADLASHLQDAFKGMLSLADEALPL